MTLANKLEAGMNEIEWLLPREGPFCTDDKCVATARGVRGGDVPRLTKGPSLQFDEQLQIQYNM